MTMTEVAFISRGLCLENHFFTRVQSSVLEIFNKLSH